MALDLNVGHSVITEVEFKSPISRFKSKVSPHI